MAVSEVLRAAREDTGATLRSVAGRVGVNPAYLSRVERGKVRPSRALLESLAKELELDEEQVLVLGGFLPDAWRDSVERRSLRAYPSRIATVSSGGGTADAVAEPTFPYASSQTIERLDELADPLEALLPEGYVPSPELNEIYELKLALLETKHLDRKGIIERGGYFIAVDGEPTRHFIFCTGGALRLPKDSGARLRSFLANHQFKTSYATHGLFPYRGKFHPQMVKALLNVMGLRPGDTVLDPMAGSGTTAVEAALMGIRSIAVDASPFCELLARAKVAALEADLSPLTRLLAHRRDLQRTHAALSSKAGMERVRDLSYEPRGMSRATFELLVLAFLDARGYAERSSRKGEYEFFLDILRKYVDTVGRFHSALKEIAAPLGDARVMRGDARCLSLPDASIDGALFSPPYSFAIDYLQNDATHLRYLGYEPNDLRSLMVGLNGRSRADQVTAYFEDMTRVLHELVRVLRPGARCTMVVGSNVNQLTRIVGRAASNGELRCGLEGRLIEIAEECGLHLELAIRRLIVGMRNSMREEHILILQRGT